MRVRYLGRFADSLILRGSRYNTGEGLRMAIEAGWDAARTVLGPLEEIWPKVQDIAARLVSAFNSAGLFNKKDSP